MVLNEVDEGAWRQAGRNLSTRAAAAVFRNFSLVAKALRKRAPQPPQRLLRIIAVIAVAFAGGQHVEGMMNIVIPLRARVARLAVAAYQAGGFIAVIFEHYVHFPLLPGPCAHGGGQLIDDVRPRVICDGMYCVQAQTV